MRSPASPSRLVLGRRLGKPFGAAAAVPPPNTSIGTPPQNRPRFMNMNDTPMAETSGASLGAPRSGLYTSLSTSQFRPPAKATQMTMMAGMATTSIAPDAASSPRIPTRVRARNGAEHEQIAVGEVDELEDPVDHGVAQRDQGEHHPVDEPQDDLLDEGLHGVA